MTIVHVNIIGFYTAVAEALDPKLRGCPLAVATPGQTRRTLLDVSRQAMIAGLGRGMLLEHAKRRCRDLVVLDPTPDVYDRAMGAVLNEANRYSPAVEPAGPGHVFIDLNGTERLWGAALDAAASLRRGLLDNYRLDPSLGVARNKLVSKVATRVIRPTGLCEVMLGGEREFLAPLPVGHLPGVDDDLLQELLELNLRIIAEIVELGADALTAAFGPPGRSLFKAAQGQDDTPVQAIDRPAPNVTELFVFPGQTNDDDALLAGLWRVCSRGARRLRNMALGTKRATLSITYADGQRVRRTGRFRESTLNDFVLFDQIERLFRAAYQRRVRLRSVALRLDDLTYPSGQLYLFDLKRDRPALLTAIDRIRDRFGENAIDPAAYRGEPSHRAVVKRIRDGCPIASAVGNSNSRNPIRVRGWPIASAVGNSNSRNPIRVRGCPIASAVGNSNSRNPIRVRGCPIASAVGNANSRNPIRVRGCPIASAVGNANSRSPDHALTTKTP
ncbi:MAG: hypothetical protein JXQ73_32865 [Phycisphaerae bacterium]|nr:hypothetical protein [Phycisphaerae bacterium]